MVKFHRCPQLRYISVSLTLMFALCVNLSAQEVIATAGESLQSSNVSVDFTLGEVVVHTETGSNIIITQGFHQSFQEVVSGLEPAADLVNISVYPNPTSDLLKIEAEENDKLKYKLFNLSGLLVLEGDFENKTEIDIRNYAKGL